jgi:hypothetical protein
MLENRQVVVFERLRFHFLLFFLCWLLVPLLWNCDTNTFCCDVAVAQINYPNFKHNTQDSIEQARGRSHEEVQVRFLC